MCDSLVLFLCQPKRSIKKVLVSNDAYVDELNTLFPHENKCFIYKGITLLHSIKLRSYGIKNMDHIVVIPESVMNSMNDKSLWMNVTKDQQDFNERMCLSTNPITRTEIARLKDLKLSKLELRRKPYTKLVTRCQNDLESHVQPSVEMVIPAKQSAIDSPNSDPLPIFWNKKSRPAFKLPRQSSEPEIEIEKPFALP